MKNWSPTLFEANLTVQQKEKYSNFIRIVRIFQHKKIPIILTLGHLAFRTGINYFELLNYINRKKCYYRNFLIHKHNKKNYRRISIPFHGLLIAQLWIKKYILDNIDISDYAYAYRRGFSIKDCAEQHIGCKWLIKIDLQDFFESISEINVYRLFYKIGYSKLVAFQLARLCTIVYESKLKKYKNKNWQGWKKYLFSSNSLIGNLPQGTPTSPALANIIASKLDNEIANYANENNYVYTRYSDDLILSSAANKTMQDAINTVHDVYSIISKNGFITNYAKTKIIKPGSRKIVLGLLVCRNKVTLSRDFKEALETHLFFIKKDMEQHKKIKSFDTTEGMINYVNGLLAYTKNIDKNYYLKIKEKYEWKF